MEINVKLDISVITPIQAARLYRGLSAGGLHSAANQLFDAMFDLYGDAFEQLVDDAFVNEWGGTVG